MVSDQLPVVVPKLAAVPLALSVVTQTRPRVGWSPDLPLPVDEGRESLHEDGLDVEVFCLARDLHSNHIQPLFIYPDAKVLSRHLIVTLTKQYISQIGLNSELYLGHSFRIAGATSAALSGLNDWQIKKLGRWNSNVYLRYIQPSNQYFPPKYTYVDGKQLSMTHNILKQKSKLAAWA